MKRRIFNGQNFATRLGEFIEMYLTTKIPMYISKEMNICIMDQICFHFEYKFFGEMRKKINKTIYTDHRMQNR